MQNSFYSKQVMSKTNPNVGLAIAAADASVNEASDVKMEQFEVAAARLRASEWDAFKKIFNAERIQASDDTLRSLYPKIELDDIKRRLDDIARNINRQHVQRFAVMFVETGIPGFFAEFERSSTQLSGDEWAELKRRLDTAVTSASDSNLAQRFPNVNVRVVRNRMDNVNRVVQQQQVERDAGTLKVKNSSRYDQPDYSIVTPTEPAPTTKVPQQPIDRVERRKETESKGFFSSAGNIAFMIGGIALALFVAAFIVLAVVYIYQRLQLRQRRDEAAESSSAAQQNAVEIEIGRDF